MKAQEMKRTAAAALEEKRVMPALRRSIFLISLPLGLLDFILPIYGKRIGADAVQIGLFFSAFSVMIVLLRPLVGGALDRFGRRPFFLAGLLGYALTMLLFALADRVWLIVAARSVQGMASACLWLSAQAMVADSAGEQERGGSFGGIAEANSQGSILGVFIGFWALFSAGILAGWRPLFSGYALMGVAALALAAFGMRETRRGEQRDAPARPLRWTRPWVMVLIGAAVSGASWAMLSPILMIYLQEKFTVEIQDLALAFLPSALVWAFLPSRLGRLADRFGRKPLMALGMLVSALTCFCIPAVGSLGMLALLWAIQALSTAAGDPAEQALVADLSGGDQRGQAYGVYTMAAGLGAIIGPLAGGWLYEHVGQAAPFYLSGLALTGAAGAIQLLLREPDRTK